MRNTVVKPAPYDDLLKLPENREAEILSASTARTDRVLKMPV